MATLHWKEKKTDANEKTERNTERTRREKTTVAATRTDSPAKEQSAHTCDHTINRTSPNQAVLCFDGEGTHRVDRRGKTKHWRLSGTRTPT